MVNVEQIELLTPLEIREKRRQVENLEYEKWTRWTWQFLALFGGNFYQLD